MHGPNGRARVYLLLAIEVLERFAWLSWFQTLTLRRVDSGPFLLLTYTLPIAFAPVVSTLGSGAGLLVALIGYAVAYLASATSAVGPWLIVVASALYKASFGPTLKTVGTSTDFARQYFVVNLGSAIGSFSYAAIIQWAGLRGFDWFCSALLMGAATLALGVRGVQSEEVTVTTKLTSWPTLIMFAASLLPITTVYWLFIDRYRVATMPLFTQAGLPSGVLLGALCLWVLAWSALLSSRRMSGVLRQGTFLIVVSGIVYALFFVLLGLAHKFDMASAWLVLLLCGLFTFAESLCGAVMQRVLMERAPKVAVGAAAFFCVMGLGGLLASRLAMVLPVPSHGAFLFWAAALVLVSPALVLGLRLNRTVGPD